MKIINKQLFFQTQVKHENVWPVLPPETLYAYTYSREEIKFEDKYTF